MARVKSAAAQITAYLKGKGLDASEIKAAFDELEAADVDLTQLTDSTVKNQEWNSFWYEKAVPQFETVTKERDQYKEKLEKLAAAGFSVAETPIVTPPAGQGNGGNFVPQEDFTKFKQDLTQAS